MHTQKRHSSCIAAMMTAGLMILLWGCRTHPERIRDARHNLALGNQAGVLKAFPKNIDPADQNGLLYLSERARLNHDMGNYQASNADIISIQEYERHVEEAEAQVKLSSAGQQTAAVVTNDEALPYRLHDFERNMLFQTAGFNYLYENPRNLPAVISNLTDLQEKQRRKAKVRTESLEQELARQNTAKNQKSLKQLQKNAVFQEQQKEADRIAAGLPSYENAYSYYFCGLYFEAQEDYGSALLAYQMAYLLKPRNSYFRESFISSAVRANRKDLLKRYQLKVPAQNQPATATDSGELIIFFESGWVPAKRPYKLSLPVYTDNSGFILVSLSFPYYPKSPVPAPILDLKIDGKQLRTEEAADLHHFAIRRLRDQMPGIITRMFLRASGRALASYAANQAIDNIQDSGARALAQVGSIFAQAGLAELEQPDLRSFLSLPHSLQIARMSLPGGRHQLAVHCCGRSQTKELTVVPGKKQILQILAAPEFLTIHSAFMPNTRELGPF